MSVETNPAQVCIVEHDALDSWLRVDSTVDSAATILEQRGEPIEKILQRMARQARDLQTSGNVIVAASLVLGGANGKRLADRQKLARGLLNLLGPEGVLHLKANAQTDPLTPFALADGLRTNLPGPAIQLHFSRKPKLRGGLRRGRDTERFNRVA